LRDYAENISAFEGVVFPYERIIISKLGENNYGIYFLQKKLVVTESITDETLSAWSGLTVKYAETLLKILEKPENAKRSILEIQAIESKVPNIGFEAGEARIFDLSSHPFSWALRRLPNAKVLASADQNKYGDVINKLYQRLLEKSSKDAETQFVLSM